MKDVLKIHEVGKIRSGKHAGLVGVITDTKNDTLRVLVEGVKNDEPFTVHVWLKRSAVERNA